MKATITLRINSRKTTVIFNEKETEHNTSFIRKLTLKDLINYLNKE